MDGIPPPTNNSPLNQPQDPLTPPVSNGGIQLSTGQRYTPDSPGQIPDTPIGARAGYVLNNVQPQLNSHAQMQQLSDQYEKHHAQAVAIANELNLANSVPTIHHLLENPDKASRCTRFSIFWVPDDGGDPVRVIPPSEKMEQQRDLAKELRETLGNQLTKLESRYTPSKVQELQSQYDREIALRDHVAPELLKMGGSLPVLQAPTNITVFGASTINTAIEPQPVSDPASTPARTDGQFMINFSPSISSEQPVPLHQPGQPFPPLAESESEYGESTQLPPHQNTSSSPVPFGFRPSDHENEGEGEGEGEVFPPPPPGMSASTPFTTPTVSLATPVAISPLLSSAGVTYTILGAGRDGIHSDIYRLPGFPSAGNMASVNAGDDSFGFAGSGINETFRVEANYKDPEGRNIKALHQSMWNSFPAGHYNAATVEQLQRAPGVKASFIYKPESSRGQTGTIIIDVFDAPYPGNNPDNRAMIYVVQPNGQLWSSKDFKDQVTITASDVVGTLQAYNTHAQQVGGLPPIPDVRICGFSSGQARHPEVTKAEVGECIEKGVTHALEHIQKKQQLTIKNVEFADGNGKVFSGMAREAAIIPDLMPLASSSQPASYDPTTADEQPDIDEMLRMPPSSDTVSKPLPASYDQDELNTPVLMPDVEPLMPQPLNPADSSEYHFPVFGQNSHLTPLPQNRAELELRAMQQVNPSLSRHIEANKAEYAREALAATHGPLPAPYQPPVNAKTDGRLHSVRKALLTRALINFHRMHTPFGANARRIPDKALPMLEVGVLCTPPNPQGILSGKPGENPENARKTRQRLSSIVSVSQDSGSIIAEGLNGIRKTNESMLASVTKDVELIENMRFQDNFNVDSLSCYSMYGEQAQQELALLCHEYKDLLAEQEDLTCGLNEKLVISSPGNIPLAVQKLPGTVRTFSADARRDYENRPDLFSDVQAQFNKKNQFSRLYQYTNSI